MEQLENRPPEDIDIVTFFHLPKGISQKTLFKRAPRLFDNQHKEALKAFYHVDHYFVHLDDKPERLINQTIYRYSIWSHRRNLQWRGFIEINLSPNSDPDAAKILRTLTGDTNGQ